MTGLQRSRLQPETGAWPLLGGSNAIRQGVSHEDATARTKQAIGELKEFAEANKNEKGDRSSLSSDAISILIKLESEGTYPYERYDVHDETADKLKAQTELLKGAMKSGNLRAAQKTIETVIDLRKAYREHQIGIGQSVIVQPKELFEYENELTAYRKFKMRLPGVSRLMQDSPGAVPPNPFGHLIESGEGLPDALGPVMRWHIGPALQAADPQTRAALGLTQEPGADPRSLQELTMRIEGMETAGFKIPPAFERLIRPMWARSNDLKQYGYTLEQAEEIKALAQANNVDPMDMAHHLLFPDQLDPHLEGMAVPADAFEKYGLGQKTHHRPLWNDVSVLWGKGSWPRLWAR